MKDYEISYFFYNLKITSDFLMLITAEPIFHAFYFSFKIISVDCFCLSSFFPKNLMFSAMRLVFLWVQNCLQ